MSCGRVLGHGESCVKGHLCGSCEKINELEKQLARQAESLRQPREMRELDICPGCCEGRLFTNRGGWLSCAGCKNEYGDPCHG